MRQTVIGIFAQQSSAEATLRRLEMRGFDVECRPTRATGAPRRGEAATGSVEKPGKSRGAVSRVLLTVKAVLAKSLMAKPPHPDEVHLEVRTNSAMEARAAREILRASGAREAGCLGEGWTNWNW